nr:MAG: putative RNA dependent RNA polymerase [Palkane alphapartitivirus 2]
MYNQALLQLKKAINVTEKLKTVHFTGTRMYDLNKSGSAELPYTADPNFKKHVLKRFEKGEIVNQLLTKGNGENFILFKERGKLHQIKDQILPHEKLLHDIRMHARSHLTKVEKEDKVRAVYGVPCTVIYAEIMIFWPLLAHLKEQENSFIAWGYETFRGGLEKLRIEVHDYDLHLSLDFSTFDKLIPFWLIDDIYQIFISLYELGPYYEDDPDYPNPKTNPQRIKNIWEFVLYSVKHSTYRAPDGSRYQRKHSGFPSGLLQTQLLGSCCNYVMIVTALNILGFSENQFSIKVLGDDSCVSLRTQKPPQDIIRDISLICKQFFNAIINTDKSTFSVGTSNLQFLSYKLDKGAVIRVNDDLLGKLVYPEKAHFTRETTRSRALGILISNLGYDEHIHIVCCNIIEKLSEYAYTTKGLNWYDQQRLEILKKFTNQIPSRHDLFIMALTPLPKLTDTNFNKYLR